MMAAAGDWFAVPRRGRVDEAVGAALGAVRGAGGGRARSRGMLASWTGRRRAAGRAAVQHEGMRRRQTRAWACNSLQGCWGRWHRCSRERRGAIGGLIGVMRA